jgi:hypothetical protein
MTALPKDQPGGRTGRRVLMKEPTAPIRRKHKRVPMRAPAFYDDRQYPINEKETLLSQGTVRDFSDFGICLFTNAPLQRGESVTVFCKDIWSAEKCGTVLWCNTVDLRLFRVGIGLQ